MNDLTFGRAVVNALDGDVCRSAALTLAQLADGDRDGLRDVLEMLGLCEAV